MSDLFMYGFEPFAPVPDDPGVMTSAAQVAAQGLLLDGLFAELNDTATSFGPPTPVIASHDGDVWLYLAGLARHVLGGDKDTVRVAMRVYQTALPNTANTRRICEFRNSDNETHCSVVIQTDGRISLIAGTSGAVITQTTEPVVQAASAHHVEFEVTMDGSTGTFKLWVDEVLKLNSSALATETQTPASCAQVTFGDFAATLPSSTYIKDVIVGDDQGSYNATAPLGDRQVSVIFPVENTVLNWASKSRYLFSDGALEFDGVTDALDVADHADFDLGSGDHTLEAWVRFRSLPAGSAVATIIAKWDDATVKSYRLAYCGPSLGSVLRFEVSTDGSAETTVSSYAWTPNLNQWYHIAVARDTAVTKLFVDGVEVDSDADANAYNDSNASVGIGGTMDGSLTSVLADTTLDGWIDEVRITKGVGRYTSGFTAPSADFGRTVGEDSDYNSVSLLLGFNALIADEGPTGHTASLRGNAALVHAGDQAGGYTTLDNIPPRDDTWIEAELLAATGVFAPSDNPSDSETCVIGTSGSEVTYTFVTSLSTAFDVLIGANIDETLDNLQAAVNGEAGEGSTYGTGTAAHTEAAALNNGDDTLTFTAITPGAGGNSILTSDTVDGGFLEANLIGGADIPAASEFLLDTIPYDATVVTSAQILTRSYKSASGSAQQQASIVMGGTDADGADRAITTTPTYWRDIIEEDPNTMSGLTPSSFANARLKIDRTV